MNKPVYPKILATITLPTILCGGCVHLYTNEAIFNDPDAYAADYFSPGKLNSVSKQYVSQLHKPTATFRTMTVSAASTVEGDGKSRVNPRVEFVYTNIGDGQIREIARYTNNDIPLHFAFSNGYLGMFPFRMQTLPYGMARAKDVDEVKSISSFPLDAWKPVEGKVYEYIGTVGGEPHIAGFVPFSITCKAGPSYRVGLLAIKLSGLATDFTCERKVNNIIMGKSVFALLHDYGVAIRVSAQTSKFKETLSIVNVQVD